MSTKSVSHLVTHEKGAFWVMNDDPRDPISVGDDISFEHKGKMLNGSVTNVLNGHGDENLVDVVYQFQDEEAPPLSDVCCVCDHRFIPSDPRVERHGSSYHPLCLLKDEDEVMFCRDMGFD